MKRTTAPGSSAGQYVDDNPALGVVGTLLVAEDRNIIQEELVNAVEGAGLSLSGADSAQVMKAIKKITVEKSKKVGEVFSLLDYEAPVAWNPATPDTYFPAVCLTNINGSVDVLDSEVPDLVTYLRAIKAGYQKGTASEKTAFDVTNWAISSNVATLTFANTTAEIAFLMTLAEDQAFHGSFTNYRTITLASAIGDITAGTYALTAINAAARTVSFAFTAANNSGAVTATAQFYAHRVAGSTTSARLFGCQGLALHGANDANNYFIGTLRRRDEMQGHWHRIEYLANAGSGGGVDNANLSNSTSNRENRVVNPVTDGVNGTPRTGKTTHSPALGVHLYVHAGRKIA